MAFLIVGTLSFVVAEDVSVEEDIPQAKKIGFFENAFDNVGLAFTFNKEAKIKRALELAEKRLAEAEVLAEENPEEAEKAQERYNAFVAKAENILEKISNTEAENENLSIDNIAMIARIQNRFEKHRERTERIYVRALERFEENNASDEKIERFENFYNRSLTRSEEMEAKIIQKKEVAIKRHKVLAEKSDEELEDILENIEEREGLIEAREQRIERAEVRVQKIVAVRQRNIERTEARLDEGNLTDEQKAKIANRIKVANEKLQQFEVQARERIETRANLTAEKIAKNSNALKNAVNQELSNRAGGQ